MKVLGHCSPSSFSVNKQGEKEKTTSLEQFITSKVSSTAWLRGHARKGPAGSNLRHAGAREKVLNTLRAKPGNNI